MEMVVPIYEYTCTACGTPFEQLIRSSRDERELTCPKCGGKQVERQLSVIAAPRAKAAAPPAGPCGQCCSPDGGCPYQQD